MTRHILFIFIAFSMTSCNNIVEKGREESSFKQDIKTGDETTDTSKLFIVVYDQSRNGLTENYKPAILSKSDIAEVEVLLNKSISAFNLKQDDSININDYKRQYTPVNNDKGEKEVWIYCSCSGNFGMVIDGGKCYFKLKVNLTRKNYTEVITNSEG